MMSLPRLVEMLEPPPPVRVVIDTDADNEIDDQFALAYALLSPERTAAEAIHAAAYTNERFIGPNDRLVRPEEGTERSHDEVRRVLSHLNRVREVLGLGRDAIVADLLGKLGGHAST